MSTIARHITNETAPSTTKERKVRFATKAQAKRAGNWVIKKYASVFKKLAE